MPKKENISKYIQFKFGIFTVLEDAGTKSNSRYVICKCDCGVIKEVRLSDLKNGSSTNCGCVRKSYLTKKNTTHNLSHHPLNRIWRGINERCYYQKHKYYHRYGGRGVSVCDEWRNDFMAFYNWAIANGWKDGLEVDRKNNDGNYNPDNCRIVTLSINRRNKSTNRLITYNGVTKCMVEWAEITGIHQDTIKDRLNKLGWPIEKALTTPVKTNICS